MAPLTLEGENLMIRRLAALMLISTGLFAFLYLLKTINVALAGIFAIVIFLLVFGLCVARMVGGAATVAHRARPLQEMFPLTELEKSMLPHVSMDADEAEKLDLVEAIYDVKRLAPDAQLDAIRRQQRAS